MLSLKPLHWPGMNDLKNHRIIALKQALIKVFLGKEPLQSIVSRHPDVTNSILRRMWHLFGDNPPASQSLSINEIHIHIKVSTEIRPDLSKCIEKLIFDIALHSFKTEQPLTSTDELDLERMILRRLPSNERAQVKFRNPTRELIDGFLRHHMEVEVWHMKVVDQERVGAFNLPQVVENLSRVQLAIDQYGIHDAKIIFNLNETSVQFNKIFGRSI